MDFFSSRSNVMQGAVAGGTIRLDVARLVDLKTKDEGKVEDSLDRRPELSTQTFPAQNGSAAKLVWSGILLQPHLRDSCSIVIEATVAVKDVAAGIQDVSTAHSMEEHLCDFTVPQPDIATVALVINEKRLYVSKEFLAVHSPVFRTMFFSNFLEKDKKEIPLEDIDVDEFLEFLHVIYPSRKAVTEANIDCLLSLGDRFNSKVVMRECEAFLCGPGYSKLPLEKKLLYADRFGLSHLQALCLDSITTLKDAMAMRGKKEYGEMSDKMKATLLDKILMLR